MFESSLSFLAELKRRKVVRTLVVYVAAGLGVIYAADAIFPRLSLPEWTVTLVIVLIVLGLPVVLGLAWALDITPGGVVRTEAPERPAGDSAAPLAEGMPPTQQGPAEISAHESEIITFGEHKLVIGTRRLIGPDGDHELPELTYRALLTLLRHAPNAVTLDTFAEEAWESGYVSPETLIQRIKLVRAALGDDGMHPRLVKAVRGRGYRLDADVREISGQATTESAAATDSPQSAWKWAVLVLSVAIVATGLLLFRNQQPRDGDLEPRAPAEAPLSIAVLPFDGVGLRDSDSHLSVGLSDEVRNQLAQVPGLRIAARSSSLAARERDMEAIEAASRLGVTYLLEGSVRFENNRFRISVHLIDGATGLASWSLPLDRARRELLVSQENIARGVVEQILPQQSGFVFKPAANNATALDLMAMARKIELEVKAREDVDAERLQDAIHLYRQAIEADPNAALTHSRLADALLYVGAIESAWEPISRALQLDSELPEVQNTLGLYHWTKGEPGAGAAFQRAIDLDPSNADALSNYGFWKMWQADSDAAHKAFRRAVQFDPLNLERYITLGQYLGWHGHYTEAMEVSREIEAQFESAEDQVATFRAISLIQEAAGNVAEAIAWSIRARDLEPDNASHRSRLAELLIDLGEVELALEQQPDPGIGLIWKMRDYPKVVEIAEELLFEVQSDLRIDLRVRYLLAFSYTVEGYLAPAIALLKDTSVANPQHFARGAIELETRYLLGAALVKSGRFDDGRRLLEISEIKISETKISGSKGYTNSPDWWHTLFSACNKLFLGNLEGAHQALRHARNGRRLPWQPILRDSICFDELADDPEYLATVRHFEKLQEEQRELLPETLDAHGVSL